MLHRMIAVVGFLLVVLSAVSAQDESKEMRTLRLRLQEAQLNLDESSAALAKSETSLKESQELFGKGLISKTELSGAQDNFSSAKVNQSRAAIDLEKTRLTFLNNALYVTLGKAAVSLDADGRKHVILTLKNNSNTRKIIDDNGAYSADEKASLLTIENLSVRILQNDKIVGRPFEYKIPELRYNQSRDVDFLLQKDVEDVTVEIAYGDTNIHLPVILEKEAKQDRVLIQAMQFSQEGDLGGRVTYDLDLERFVDDNKVFSLEVRSLPPEYTTEFHEIESGSDGDQRVSSIRFKSGVTTKTIRVVVNMPKEIKKESLSEKIPFFVLLLDRFAQQRLAALLATKKGMAVLAPDLDSAGISYEALELMPRGKAEITIVANNLFIKQKIGDAIKLSFDLYNSGTVALDRVRVYPTMPLNWTANITPPKDIALDVEAKSKVTMEVLPAVDVVPGDYEIKLEAKTFHEGREVGAVEKIVRLQIEGKSNFLIGAILMIVLIGLIVGVAVMTIRISRR